PRRSPTVTVMVIPWLLRLFYPLYNTYVVCGKHGPFRSYARFWQSSATKRAIAERVDECIGPFQEIATAYDVVGDLELSFNRKGACLYSRGTMKIPPAIDSDKIKELTEVLTAVASCYATSWKSQTR